MRAIIVEDSRAMRKILAGILQELKFEVYEAGDGVAALELLRELGCPDLAMVDWNMPHMNGYDFARLIRTQVAYDEMKIMMVTTECDVDQVEAALRAGVDEYVMKPFTSEVIAEKLQLLGVAGGAKR